MDFKKQLIFRINSVLGIPWLLFSTEFHLHLTKRICEEKCSDLEQMAQWQELFWPGKVSLDPDSEPVRHTTFLRSFCGFLLHSLQPPSPNPYPGPVSQLTGKDNVRHFLLYTHAASLMSLALLSFFPILILKKKNHVNILQL